MSARPMKLHLYRARWFTYISAEGLEDVIEHEHHGWRWRIRATNGRILADSGEAYQRLRDCAHGAGLVIGQVLVVAPLGSTPLSRLIGPGWSLDYTDDRGRAWRITVDK